MPVNLLYYKEIPPISVPPLSEMALNWLHDSKQEPWGLYSSWNFPRMFAACGRFTYYRAGVGDWGGEQECVWKHVATRPHGVIKLVNLLPVLCVLVSSNTFPQFLHLNDSCPFLTTFIYIDKRNSILQRGDGGCIYMYVPPVSGYSHYRNTLWPS